MVCLAKKGVEKVFFGYGCGLFVTVVRYKSVFWDVFAIIGLVNDNVEGVGGLTKVLFADHDVGVSLFFEEVGKGWEVGEAGHAVFPHAVNGGVQAGDETAARGVAYRRGRVSLCEHHAFGREAICMG